MKKIDFEKMEKIESGKHWQAPQPTAATKKNPQAKTDSNTKATQIKSALKS
jgi:hypothetical protein